jgi:hypothetical protein
MEAAPVTSSLPAIADALLKKKNIPDVVHTSGDDIRSLATLL